MSIWLTTKRVAQYGLIGFIRNGFISLSAVLIMTITLFVAASLMISGAALNAVLNDLTNKVDVTVYFTTDATYDQIMQISQSVSSLPEVASVNYVTRDQALAQFQARHQNDQLTMQALDELGGPLPVPGYHLRHLGVQEVKGLGEGAVPGSGDFFRRRQSGACGCRVCAKRYVP